MWQTKYFNRERKKKFFVSVSSDEIHYRSLEIILTRIYILKTYNLAALFVLTTNIMNEWIKVTIKFRLKYPFGTLRRYKRTFEVWWRSTNDEKDNATGHWATLLETIKFRLRTHQRRWITLTQRNYEVKFKTVIFVWW